MNLRRTLLTTCALLAGSAPASYAQTPFDFQGLLTNPNAPALSASSLNTSGGTKLDVAASGQINVKQFPYLAKCDGVTDDTSAFQAAFAFAASEPTGDTITVPAGRCKVSAALPLTLTGNTAVTLRGSGRDISEIVWSGSTNGLQVTLNSTGFSYMRTANNPAPVFHLDGISLVSSSATPTGAALTITSNAVSNAASGGGLAPQVKLHDLGIHGTALTTGGWHDGVSVSNLPSGMQWDDGYIVFANQPPPYASVGNGIHIQGGTPDANNNVSVVSALYFLSKITIQNANHGVDVGPGVQDVDMDKVGGNAAWFVYAANVVSLNSGPGGQLGTMRMAHSNPTGYYGSWHSVNVGYITLQDNQPQPFALSPTTNYVAFEFLEQDTALPNGGVVHGDGGLIDVKDNKIVLNCRNRSGASCIGVHIHKDFDVVGGYNPDMVTGNHFSLMDTAVVVDGPAVGTMVMGNEINNTTLKYILPDYNYTINNMINGHMEGFNSTGDPINTPGNVVQSGFTTTAQLLTTAAGLANNAAVSVASGSSASDAPPINQQFTDVTSIGLGSAVGVRMSPLVGFEQTIWNDTTQPITVYVPSGMTLDGGASVSVAAGARYRAACLTTTVCKRTSS